VLVDATAELADHGVESRPQVVHDLGDVLGVHPLRHVGEAAHIGEQNRDLAATRGSLTQGRQFPLQRREGPVDHRILENSAQLLLGGDRRLELLAFIHFPILAPRWIRAGPLEIR
jgi:hypothetical protein